MNQNEETNNDTKDGQQRDKRTDAPTTLIGNNRDVQIEIRPHVCGTCDKGFKKKCDLRIHERIHNDEKPYQCELCRYKSRIKSNLTSHMVSMHADDERFKSNKHLYVRGISYKCETCNKEFKNKKNLHIHERIHNDEKPYECDFCKRKFRIKYTLTSHIVAMHADDERFKSNKDLYTGGVSYKCGTCNKEFKNKAYFLNHKKIHEDEKPYECEFCKHKFRFISNLRSHVVLKHNTDECFKANKDLYTGGVTYQCGTCKKIFKDKTHFRNHERIHNGEKPYQCKLCAEYKCRIKGILISHIVAMHADDERFKSNKDLYTGGVSYKCGTCNKQFKNKTAFNRHERTHTGEKPYECDFCERKFRIKDTLTSHIVAMHADDERFKSNKDLYTGGVSYKCGTCNKQFKNKTAFNRHERTHTGEKPYQCELCENEFRTKDNLSTHMVALHANDERFKSNKHLYVRGKSYKCETCNKEFKNKAHLINHKKIHEDEKPYECEFCKHKFRFIGNLRSHVVLKHNTDERFKANKDLYTGGVTYQCGTCKKMFKDKTHFLNHKKIHEDERPYPCEFCKHKFRTKDNLSTHMVALHANDERFKSNKHLYVRGKSYKCETCNKEFKNKAHFLNHKKIHEDEKPYECEFCKHKFRFIGNLRSHVVLKHNTDERFKANRDLYTGGVSYKCGTCNKEFKCKWKFQRHERTHKGEKPYQCKFCKYKCGDKWNLKKHVTRKHGNVERSKCNNDLYTGGVSYKCGTCNNEFKSKAHLHIHERTHIGEKPYHCEFCGDMFRWVHS
ncbi:PREDICTED: zinc finger protein 665-like [Cyphomyrmex costatus]|uniref:zinc finger protein 665-like n=1 Tax=Cyphomyrmex costatus TaxID=456900 RepID=UPI0008523920|nr:PREDICTED: zinc finger protein 665-like [Cyphomyrmex costatus]